MTGCILKRGLRTHIADEDRKAKRRRHANAGNSGAEFRWCGIITGWTSCRPRKLLAHSSCPRERSRESAGKLLYFLYESTTSP